MARKSKQDDFDDIIDFNSEQEDLFAEQNKKILFDFGKDTEKKPDSTDLKQIPKSSPIQTLKSRMNKPESDTPDGDNSLLKRLKRYTTDETGHDVTEDKLPLYTLQSVAEIIKNDSNSIIDKLSQKYDVQIDRLSRSNDDYLLKEIDDEQKEDTESSNSETTVSPTPAFKKMTKESASRFKKNLFDELFENEEKPPETKSEDKPDISDIDNLDTDEEKAEETPKISDTATIRFTPVFDQKGNTGRINISSTTRPIDIRQELTDNGEPEEQITNSALQMSDFDLYVQKDEVTDMGCAKSAIKKLSYKRRKNFISTALCVICGIIMLLFEMPVLSDITISSPKVVTILCGILLLTEIFANFDMFSDIINVFKRNAGHDCVISLCAISFIPLCITAIIKGENIYHLLLLGSLIMIVRAVTAFAESSVMLSNLKLAFGRREKYGVAFIKENSTALAMAKNSIDGDVLIAAPRKTDFISDFMKFSCFKKKLFGKMNIVFFTALSFAVLGFLAAYFYYKTVLSSLYTFTVILATAAMPALCFIDVLPLFSASKRLKRNGAMIAGTFGAESLELANSAVIDSADIFPKGCVVLKDIKVLSESNIDRVLVNAAALTSEIGSPLAPIFNKIAGTNSSYKKPDSDTIKYEETLGISGWVDNELMFIGNRSLMEAHGIKVPSLQLDKKILQNHFPVYVATANKACALLIVDYEVRKDIQKVLFKASKLGITMLVNNCDPNINEEMICDYFGLYDDSVKVMTNVGAYMYRSAVTKTDILSAPAAFKRNGLSLIRIMNCASAIKSSNTVLSVFYILAAFFGFWYFIYSSFAQAGGLLSGAAMLLFELLATVLAVIAFLFRKP